MKDYFTVSDAFSSEAELFKRRIGSFFGNFFPLEPLIASAHEESAAQKETAWQGVNALPRGAGRAARG